MNRTAVVTISSREPDPVKESYYHLGAFKESAKRHDIEPHFLNEMPWMGLMTKPRSLLKYLEREGAAFSHVVMTDAWDIVWVSGLDAIMAKYKGLDSPIVWNAERNCFPRADLAENHPPALSPYRYLNSGFMVGTVEAVIMMLREMNLPSLPDDKLPDGTVVNTVDQEHYMIWHLAHPQVSQLDSQCFIAQSLHEAGPDEFTQMPGYANRIVSNVTGNFPCVFHGNGSGKAWLKKIMAWQGL